MVRRCWWLLWEMYGVISPPGNEGPSVWSWLVEARLIRLRRVGHKLSDLGSVNSGNLEANKLCLIDERVCRVWRVGFVWASYALIPIVWPQTTGRAIDAENCGIVGAGSGQGRNKGRGSVGVIHINHSVMTCVPPRTDIPGWVSGWQVYNPYTRAADVNST